MAPPRKSRLSPEEERRLLELESRYSDEERPTQSERILNEIRKLNHRRTTPGEMPKVEQAPSPKLPSGFPKPSQGVTNIVYIILALGGVGTTGIAANKYVPEQPTPPPPNMVSDAELNAAMAICVKARDDVRTLTNDYKDFKPKVGSAFAHGTCEQIPGKKKGTYICGGIELDGVPQNLRVQSESINGQIKWKIK